MSNATNNWADSAATLEAVSRSMAVIEFEVDGTITQANENFLSALGYARLDEIAGKHHRIFMDPKVAASPQYTEFWNALRAGRFQAGEFSRIRRDGREIWIQASYNPVFDASGRTVKVVKFATDITAVVEERKRVAEQSASRLAVLEAMSRSMASIEFTPDGTIVSANDNFVAALGYSRAEDVVGRHHRIFVDPKAAAAPEYKEFWDALRSGKFQAGEFCRIRRDGKEVWIQASYNPVLDSSGQVVKVVKFATDITAMVQERQRGAAEVDRLVREGLRIRSAVDGSTVNTMVADERFEIVYISHALQQLLRRHEAAIQKEVPGFRVDGLIGSSIDRLHRNPNHQRNLLANLRGHHKARMTLGGRIFDLIAGVARDAAGNVVGYSVEWVDLTEQTLAQQDVERVLASAIEGDLTQRLKTDGYEGFLRVIGDGMNRLIDSTADSINQVKVAVEQIGQASGQLRTTSQMMSSSSIQLNSAATESSKSLNKAAEMVRSNAENANVANQLVTRTASAATGGEARMQEMSSAMSAINGSAQQIAKIIKVIDEIAFQTNLLALNAAVEAARAGRHGKGFAVVAQEVRNLAERSAKAAKETASLIEDSVEKVAQGVKIADATRDALREIVGNVTKVVDLAGEIATASGEQSHTIRSVTESMAQVTEGAQAGSQQSNEVASAAEEMGRQMEILQQRMSKYKIEMAAQGLAGLPADISPAMLEQILRLLRAQGVAGTPAAGGPGTNGHSANGHAANGHSANGHSANGHSANGHSANGANGHSVNGTNGKSTDPRAVLPLDRDERGFGGF